MNRTHYLKTVQPYFNAVESGFKSFEVRFNDRNYSVGDTLILHEYDADKQELTGKKIVKDVGYMLNDPAYVKEGFVNLGFL